MIQNIPKNVELWLTGDYDNNVKNEIKSLIKQKKFEQLTDAFYKNLEFGTGGLRGIMGAGTNRVNKYTIGAATQGLSNYIRKNFPELKEISVAVAHDNRNNSRFFAELTADIFSANGFKVYLFESLRPTPELSFALRHFSCRSGVVITASHNPKEYNGYKAYWDDGGQVVSPHDKNIINEVNKITNINDIKFKGVKDKIEILGKGFDTLYIDKLKSLSLSQDIIKKYSDFKIVYTPIHGTGVKLVPATLKAFGFKNIYNVPEQDVVDGNFPTVISPNPENAEALKMAIQKAKEVDADLVLATDPDADRVGIAVKDLNNEFILLNGNQTASVLIYYLIKVRVDKGLIKGNEYIVKTIVTSELLADIARKFNIEYYDTLTGFKFIAEIIKENEGKKLFIGGGEESYGYLAGEFVRDKDAVMSAALIAEAAVWAKNQGKSFYEMLVDIYVEFGLYKEVLVNLVKKGKKGSEEIQKMMTEFRENPPRTIAGSKVIEITDYLLQHCENLVTETVEPVNLPKSNVIQFFTEDNSKITVRPSGTEPKIKFYIGLKADLCCKEKYEQVNIELDTKINNIKTDLGI
ncbi:MAG: phospho-sugar mutase [Bacteroidales bacterium]|nr:phospho-sugar mutase [Bacteroidales bacterium]